MLSRNRRALHEYEVISTMEVGLILRSTEVKTISRGGVSLAGCFAGIENNELVLINCHIAHYDHVKPQNQHQIGRKIKLLARRREIEKLRGQIKQKGFTLVPLNLYRNNHGVIKMTLGLCVGKNQRDKRQAIRDKEYRRTGE